ncbi:MAG TPA: hypothetical protein DD738_06845 [Ruminiclostridium sp.]|nr:hypothetical protein [Ruminiclostridium sp.]
MKYDSLILFDWFSFTSKHYSLEGMIDLLGLTLDQFEVLPGVRGWESRLYFDGISLHVGGREEIWCEMSGQGCRAFESFGRADWNSLFEVILMDKDFNITRLDVAFDDHIGIFDLEYMVREMDAGNYVSRMKSWEYTKSNKGITLYHGSAQSKVRFRIYDKAAERNREDEGHWVRFEMVLRDGNAVRFLDLLVLQQVGEVFAKTVNNYLRYVVPGADSNKWRWETADWWYNFISVSEKVSLYEKPGVEYNIDNLEKYVVDQAGAATAAYVKIVGVEAFIGKCLYKLAATNNPKYGDLISRYAPDSNLNDLIVLM